ncbi:uroporphyrinogen-III C-methyltransferase [Pseudomonadales bacterium]|nr:uroporphyrinogen-III C-methyltransferase [Pseudomonadales bacterium]MDB4363003.1 uroporphyrinogen-III C-methyltransferase [Pseudomonadales bacterium]
MTNSKDDQPSSQDPEPIQGEHSAGVEDPEANIANESQIVAESDSSISTHDNSLRQSKDVSSSASKTGAGRILASLALLFGLAAISCSAYLGWMLMQQQERDRSLSIMAETNYEHIQTFQRALDDAKNSLAAERNDRTQAENRLQQALSDANAVLDGHTRRLLSLTATTTDDWRLAEVEYLLRLANQRILISKDAQTALNLLQAADQIVLELGNPQLFTLREAIANDSAAIAMVGELDLDGVFLKLAAQARQIDKLLLLRVPEFTSQPAPPIHNLAGASELAAPVSLTESWLARLQEIAQSTWAELKSLVVIQQRGSDIKPLLPPEQQYYLRNNLRLLINQAQLALLDGRAIPYRESLTEAVSLLENHFPLEQAANQQMVSELAALAAVKVTADYPDVSDSLIAIKAVFAEQDRLNQGAGKAP